MLTHDLAGLPYGRSRAAVRLWDAPAARPNIQLNAVFEAFLASTEWDDSEREC